MTPFDEQDRKKRVQALLDDNHIIITNGPIPDDLELEMYLYGFPVYSKKRPFNEKILSKLDVIIGLLRDIKNNQL